MANERSGRSALGMKRDISSRYVPYLLDRAVQPLVPFCETGGGSAFADWIHLMGTSSCHLSLERLIDISGSRGWSLVHRHSLISHPSTIIRSLVGQPTAKSTCVAPITHRARLSQCRSSNTSLESMYSLHQPCRLQTRPGYVGPLVLQSQSGGDLKGKGKASSTSTKAVRVVSAPSRSQQAPAPRTLSSRSSSQPIARQPRPSSSMAHLPAIQDEEEEEDIPATSRGNQYVGDQSLDLTWALRAGPTTQITPQPSLDVNSAEELRREISNLQLDMLRMARGLKVSFRNGRYMRITDGVE
jgi:hypothetical protein